MDAALTIKDRFNHETEDMNLRRVFVEWLGDHRRSDSQAHGVGCPKGLKTSPGHPACKRTTPERAVRLFKGWPARRA
jgi:hypothetical protein